MKLDIPVFVVAASTDIMTANDDNLFRLNNSMYSQVEFMVNKIVENNGMSVTIYYDEANLAFSKVFGNQITTAIKNLNNSIDVTSVGGVGELEKRSVKDTIEKNINEDTMVIILGPGKAGIVTAHIASISPSTVFYHSTWSNSELTIDYMKSISNNVYSLSLPEPKYEEAFNEFVDTMKTDYNVNYGAFPYFAYESLYFIDWVKSQGHNVTVEEIRTLISGGITYVGQFADYDIDSSGDSERQLKMMKVIGGGRYQLIE